MSAEETEILLTDEMPDGRVPRGGSPFADVFPSVPGEREPSSQGGPAPSTVAQFAAGEYLLTVGAPEGSEVAPLPAAARPVPHRRRAGVPMPDGPAPLGRGVEIAELRGLLSRGTSVRISGPSGVGRTTLVRHVASLDPAKAPDGVVVLEGRGCGLDDLLQQFHDECFSGTPYRPTRERLAELLGDVAALVVIDDLRLADGELAELLRIAPECAFLVASPEIPDPAARRDSPLHEIVLGGLPQEACFTLLTRVAGRELDDDELAWAAALWFEVEGHPGRFTQAGALLGHRGMAREGRLHDEAGELPSPGEPTKFVPRLVPLLSAPAQQVLRLATALDGVLPDPVHLPALTGAPQAEKAAVELVNAGLARREHGRYRLAGGVAEAVAPILRGPSSWAVAAIQHYTWWVSHPTVAPQEVAREATAVLACLREAERLGKSSSARTLARASAPAFAAGMRWEAWRSALELGLEAARGTGANGDQAWFLHELAVHALCSGERTRAREQVSAASRMRDLAADKRGLAADRKLLALAGDRVAGGGVDVARRARPGRRGIALLAGAAVVLGATLTVIISLGGGSSGPQHGIAPSISAVGDGGFATDDGASPGAGDAAAPAVSSSADGSASASGSKSASASKSSSAKASKSATETASSTKSAAPPPVQQNPPPTSPSPSATHSTTPPPPPPSSPGPTPTASP